MIFSYIHKITMSIARMRKSPGIICIRSYLLMTVHCFLRKAHFVSNIQANFINYIKVIFMNHGNRLCCMYTFMVNLKNWTWWHWLYRFVWNIRDIPCEYLFIINIFMCMFSDQYDIMKRMVDNSLLTGEVQKWFERLHAKDAYLF